jgi:hypothetical protein
MKIRPLKVPDVLDGFVIELMARRGRVALLRKRLKTLDRWSNYEVVIIQLGPPHYEDVEAISNGITHVERLPSSNSWGTYGWTFVEESRARQAFAEACADYDRHTAEHGKDPEPEPEEPEPEFEPEPEPDYEPEPEP